MSLRAFAVLATVSALIFISITTLALASGSPPLPSSALFQAITPRNIEEVQDRLNGSPNGRNQIPVGTVLVYKTSDGNAGKLQIVWRKSRHHIADYDLYVKFVTFKPDGSVLARRTNFRIKGTWQYDLDKGSEIGAVQNRTADLWWEWVDPRQAYLVFENGATFTIVT